MKTPVSTGREGRRLGGGQSKSGDCAKLTAFLPVTCEAAKVCSFFKFTLSSFGDAWGDGDRGRERKRKTEGGRGGGRKGQREEEGKEKYPKYPS